MNRVKVLLAYPTALVASDLFSVLTRCIHNIASSAEPQRLDVFTISDADSSQRLWGDRTVFCSRLQHFVLEHQPFPFVCKDAWSLPAADYKYRVIRDKMTALQICTPYAYRGRGGELSDLLQLPSGKMMTFDDRTVRCTHGEAGCGSSIFDISVLGMHACTTLACMPVMLICFHPQKSSCSDARHRAVGEMLGYIAPCNSLCLTHGMPKPACCCAVCECHNLPRQTSYTVLSTHSTPKHMAA